MLSACCNAEILYDAWVTSNGEVYAIFDYSICSKCDEENPRPLEEEPANDNVLDS
jgi:hypothetical protein